MSDGRQARAIKGTSFRLRSANVRPPDGPAKCTSSHPARVGLSTLMRLVTTRRCCVVQQTMITVVLIRA
jgi:hypothetical protein